MKSGLSDEFALSDVSVINYCLLML